MKHSLTLNLMKKLLVAIVFIGIAISSADCQNWKIQGNGNTNSGDYLGTSNIKPLSLRTNGFERLLINAKGPIEMMACETCIAGSYKYFSLLDPNRILNNNNKVIEITGNQTTDNTDFKVWTDIGKSTIQARGSSSGIGLVSSMQGTDPGLKLYDSNSSSLIFDQNFEALIPEVSASGDLGSTTNKWNDLYLDGKADVNGFKLNTGAQLGYVLTCTNASGMAEWTQPPSNLWIKNGNDIYSNKINFVGIGTTIPTAKLHVKEKGTLGVANLLRKSVLRMELENLSNQNDPTTIFDLKLDSKGEFIISEEINGVENARMVIDEVGYMGIGNANPKAILHVKEKGSPGVTNSLRKSMLRMEVDNLSNLISPPTVFDLEVDSKGEFIISEEINGVANARMVINDVGYMGVGSTNPKARLHVNNVGVVAINGVQPINLLAEVGTSQTKAIVVSNLNSSNCPGEYTFSVNGAGRVVATEVEVRSNWCDYVFEPDYDLMPISELKNYLAKNKHLPNIPPAVDVETNGLQLGNMQMRMMEKIEELTLYTINQQEEIDDLKAMNEKLIDIIQSKK